jgi:hypothetical protein
MDVDGHELERDVVIHRDELRELDRGNSVILQHEPLIQIERTRAGFWLKRYERASTSNVIDFVAERERRMKARAAQ